MRVVACLKSVDGRPRADVTAAPEAVDDRFSGMSAADEAALEGALAIGGTWGVETAAVTFGTVAADVVLRSALAAGVASVIRVDGAGNADSAVVAAAVASTLQVGDLVICGDYSADRGTGSVPAFIAATLEVPQALGLVEVSLETGRTIAALRRLDGGRRERLSVSLVDGHGAVLSVEGSTARLRRAGLGSVIRARTAPIAIVSWPTLEPAGAPAPHVRPFRPRPRVLAAPVGFHPLDRLRALTDSAAVTGTATGETIVLDPDAAAHRIIAALTTWDYLAGTNL